MATKILILILIGSVIAALVGIMMQELRLPEEYVRGLVKSYYSELDKQILLEGKVVIVTGSTSGLGKGIAEQLYKLGATVVVASRSQSKCEEIVEYIKAKYPTSTGSLVSHQLDLSNLDSVKLFVSWFTHSYSALDFLVNNAGINYETLRQKSTPENPLCSPQGYDLTFASNYLGHFLLTDNLLSSLAAAHPRGRIVQVSSNAHFQVNGSDLRPLGPSRGEEDRPLAARCTVNDERHAKYSYGNSKLAQVLHSVALQEELDRSNELAGLKVINVSPGLTLTGMVPANFLVRSLLGTFMFTSEAAALSSFYAMFAPGLQGGADYIVNTRASWVFSNTAEKVRDKCGLFGKVGLVACRAGTVALLGMQQRLSYGTPKLDSVNVAVHDSNSLLAKQFYDWSKLTVSEEGIQP